MELKDKIKYYREKNNMTKSELARKIGVSPSYITKLENGEKVNPSLELQLKICKALNCSISDLTNNKYFIGQYILEMILNAGFSIEQISKKTNIPKSELENIRIGNDHIDKNRRKLIKSIALFVTDNPNNSPNKTKAKVSTLKDDEISLLYLFNKLNDIGREKVINYAKDLFENIKYQNTKLP